MSHVISEGSILFQLPMMLLISSGGTGSSQLAPSKASFRRSLPARIIKSATNRIINKSDPLPSTYGDIFVGQGRADAADESKTWKQTRCGCLLLYNKHGLSSLCEITMIRTVVCYVSHDRPVASCQEDAYAQICAASVVSIGRNDPQDARSVV